MDYHVHPGYSIDAAPSSIDAYCRRAVELKLREICFTTHLEVDPVRRDIDWLVRCDSQVRKMDEPDWLDVYFRDLDRARAAYAGVLTVKAGIEVGYEPGEEERIHRVLSSYPFDFVLGSIHCLEHVAISSKKECHRYYHGKDCARVADDYFRVLKMAVETGLFDCLAHIDLYRRYGINFLGPGVHDLHRGRVEDVLRLMAGRGMGLEINTSGLRRGLGDLHPSAEILELAVQYGVRYFTTGSDAHHLLETGSGLELANQLLDRFSLTPATYARRRPEGPGQVDKPARVP